MSQLNHLSPSSMPTTTASNEVTLKIDGMSCQACASRIEKVLNKKTAIVQADVNYANEVAHVRYDSHQTDPEQILEWVNKTGYHAVVQQQEDLFNHTPETVALPWQLIAIWVCLLPFLVGMVGMFMGLPQLTLPLWLQFSLATLVQFGLALPFYKSAWASIKGGLANMDVLVVLGTLTIWAYSTYNWLHMLNNHTAATMSTMAMPPVYFEAGVMVFAFVKLGKYLEQRTKKHSLNSINMLLALTPEEVEVKAADGTWQTQPINQLHPGQVLLAKAGMRIGADGIVKAGDGWCDESHLTGEAEPRLKINGEAVLAGAIVTNGSFEYKITALGSRTQLGDMIQALNDAQGSKAAIARLADKVAGIFVPVVIMLAVLTFIVNYGWLKVFDVALMRAVSVLVIACPCALGLATPAAIMAGMGIAARHGVWFKDAQALEAAGHIDTVVMDKTGTLTVGKPKLVAHYIVDQGLNLEDILAVMATVERHANHPLANTLVEVADQYFAERHLSLPVFNINHVNQVAGQGIEAQLEGVGNVRIGTPQFAQMRLPDSLWQSSDNVWQIASIVAMSVDGVALVAFALADSLKADTSKVISQLRQARLNTIIMSGDRQSVVDYIAQQLRLNEAYGELSPRDKADKIDQLQQQGHKVAMVGDGVNDAPAMATATASFAVYQSTAVAQHSASARLMGDSLSHVYSAVDIARATLRNIKQNLFFAFVYNCLGIPLAAFGLLNPMVAAAAMALSSISVLLNALRLSHYRQR